MNCSRWPDLVPTEKWTGKISKDALSIASDGANGGKADMKPIERKSSTLGQKPPVGAVVLFPFEERKASNLDQSVNKHWVCKPDGSVLSAGATTRPTKNITYGYGWLAFSAHFRR